MIHATKTAPPNTSNDPRQISEWARKYAKNRALGLIAFQIIFLLLFIGIAGPSYFGGMAYRNGQWPLFWVCIVTLVIALAATVYISVPRWAGKLMKQITERLYASEGQVQFNPLAACDRGTIRIFIPLLFVGCVFATVLLGLFGFIPDRYMVPVSALYVVPFLLMLLISKQSVIGGPIMLLWPALYAVHAILILAGVPILFSGHWEALNMLFPTVGYGLLTGLASHFYSRIALRKLRRIARDSIEGEAVGDRQP